MDEAAKLSAEATPPEAFADYQTAILTIKNLKLINDAQGLADLENEVAAARDFTPEQRKYLTSLIGEARKEIGEAEPMADVLKKLFGDSRGNESDRNAVRARVEGGGWSIVWGVTINEAEYAKLIAAIAASIASGNPGPIKAYFDAYLDQSIDKFRRNAPGSPGRRSSTPC